MERRDAGYRIETLAVHAGDRRPGPEGSIVFPIFQGTVYSVEPGTDDHDIKYIRLNSTPTQRYLHDRLAAERPAERSSAEVCSIARTRLVSASRRSTRRYALSM